MTLGAKVVLATQPLVGDERDEIANLVMRIKKADERARNLEASKPVIPAEDIQWAEDWKLPREVFEYFELDHAA